MFVLGLQVRATSLNELVYKNGQAGVTKATVSITFDNSNKNQSPVGYEHYDEITVTRQVRHFWWSGTWPWSNSVTALLLRSWSDYDQ